MRSPTVDLQQSTILKYAKELRLPMLGGQFARLAEEAARQGQSHMSYLEALLEAELEERERNAIARRIVEAHFPKVKTLEEFEFEKASQVPAPLIRNLAGGGYLDRAEPVVLLGETGTGKTHLAIGLAVAACQRRKRVRYTTAAALVNDLMEAKDKSELNRITRRWTRYEVNGKNKSSQKRSDGLRSAAYSTIVECLGSCRIHGTNGKKRFMTWENDSERRRLPCKKTLFQLIQPLDGVYEDMLQMASIPCSRAPQPN